MTGELTRTLWRDLFIDLEQDCPWAGPRPQTDELDGRHPHRFVARKTDVEGLLQSLESNSLVVLHGESGVGKSTLLNVGLLNLLRRRGYLVLPFGGTGLGQREQSWGNLGTKDPETFLVDDFQSRNQLHPDALAKLGEGHGLIEVLNRFYGGKAIVVLDQLEELLRGDVASYEQLVRWVLQANHTSRVRVLLSLRSEYVYRLRGLLDEARPFTTAYINLKSLDRADQIREVIEAPNLERDAIQLAAVNLLVSRWTAAKERGAAPHLLAVQACLYSLHGLATDAGRSRIEVADVENLLQTGTLVDTGSVGTTDIFEASLYRAIDRKLDHCARAANATGAALPDTLMRMARQGVRSAVPHLSSGGFKLERELGDLMLASLEREFELTNWDDAEARQLLSELVRKRDSFDYLRGSRRAIAEACGIDHVEPQEDSRALAAYGVDLKPWLEDPHDVSAGPMLGLCPRALLIEQVRAFVFALDWLETSSLVRLPSDDRVRRVSLVHDGFGPALNLWSSHRQSDPWEAVTALVAHEGRRFAWAPDCGEPFINPPGQPRYLTNLRWRQCRVSGASFTNLVLLNCDFRATIFERCRFEGVTLVNCLLDGASFERCEIVGATDLSSLDAHARLIRASDETDAGGGLPSFKVDGQVARTLASELRWYRGGARTATEVYSATSGVPAAPWDFGRDPLPVIEWTPQPGGLVAYGGRLSSLMVNDCTFSEGGQLGLCHMEGSSLDFTEQPEGSIALYRTTVRGVAFTGRVGASEAPWTPSALSVVAASSVLLNVFFGAGLAGKVDILNSQVFGISSASLEPDRTARKEGLLVTLDDCRVAHADNVTVKPNCGAFRELERFEVAESESGKQEIVQLTIDPQAIARLFAETTAGMAYRSRPARLELEKRAGAR